MNTNPALADPTASVPVPEIANEATAQLCKHLTPPLTVWFMIYGLAWATGAQTAPGAVLHAFLEFSYYLGLFTVAWIFLPLTLLRLMLALRAPETRRWQTLTISTIELTATAFCIVLVYELLPQALTTLAAHSDVDLQLHNLLPTRK
jgi:hypothetical protein